MNTNNKKRLWFSAGFLLLVVIIFLAYIQLIYQPKKVDTGLVTLNTTFTGHENIVTAVRFLPGDSLLITGSVDSTIKIWKRESGEIITTIRQPHGITYMDINTEGNYVVTGSYDGITRVWGVADGALKNEWKGHAGTVWAVAFSNDGKFVASCGEDKTITVWNRVTGELLHTLNGHTRNIWSVKFSPDGTKLASCGFDYTFKIWDLANGKLLRNNTEHSQTVVDVAFSNNGQILASTSDDCTIKLWNMDNGKLVRSMEVPEHVQAVAFSNDDKLLMTGGRDKTLVGEFVQTFFGDSEFNKGVSARLYSVETGALLHTFTHHSNDVNDVAFSHDGKYIATASADGTADVWQLGNTKYEIRK